MTDPYRAHVVARYVPAPPRPFRCYFGLHKPTSFTVTASKRYICVGMTLRFFCACGKYLGRREGPTRRPVTIKVAAGWDGMGGSS